MHMIITENLSGERLDKILAQLLPKASLRHRRRLIESGAALLDGHKARPGTKVFEGQAIEIAAKVEAVIPTGVAVLHREGDYAAVAKPCGVHSATIRGGQDENVEAVLSLLLPGENPILLNRLDRDTSGLVLIAFTPEAEERFRAMEAAGQVRKEYVAKVHGRLAGAMVIRNRLDMADRRKVRVLDEYDPDPARHTHVQPLEEVPAEELSADKGTDRDTTIVQAIIARGARHQIRAHLAHAGHPLVGDLLYGQSREENGAKTGGEDKLCLHHRAISFAGFSASTEISWGD